jgi:hypothetical protein
MDKLLFIKKCQHTLIERVGVQECCNAGKSVTPLPSAPSLKVRGGEGELWHVAVFLCSITILFIGYITPSDAFKLPDTGQTKCCQSESPYAEIPCEGTGQDGAYIINPMSFYDNGNGTVTDNNTGVMWQKEDDGNYYNWYQASGIYDSTYNPSLQNVCGSLNLGGHSDWRLPTKKELMTIVDYSIPYPGPTINTTYFPNTKSSHYWSSTTYAYNPSSAWSVYFSYGYVYGGSKHYDGYYVRCVRGGQ